jgi:outer membrane protein assembly factor BamB
MAKDGRFRVDLDSLKQKGTTSSHVGFTPLSPGCPGLNGQKHHSQTQLDWKDCTMNHFELLLKLFKEMPIPAKLFSKSGRHVASWTKTAGLWCISVILLFILGCGTPSAANTPEQRPDKSTSQGVQEQSTQSSDNATPSGELRDETVTVDPTPAISSPLQSQSPKIRAETINSVNSTQNNNDWPQWRGPNSNGLSENRHLPIRWDRDNNIAWSVELPGSGASSPVVFNNRVFVTSEVESNGKKSLLTLCFDRNDGRELWRHDFGFGYDQPTHEKSNLACITPLATSDALYVGFGNAEYARYTHDGNVSWISRLVPLLGKPHTSWGFSSSPVVLDDVVVIPFEHHRDPCFLVGLDKQTGNVSWKVRRNIGTNYATPVVVRHEKDVELLLAGKNRLTAFDGKTHIQLWQYGEGEGPFNGEIVVSPVYADGMVFTQLWRKSHIHAVRLNGHGIPPTPMWVTKKFGPEESSLLFFHGLLYALMENGVLVCFDAHTGDMEYQRRLGGACNSSPIASDGHLYFSNNDGKTLVVKAGRDFNLVATNDLGERITASPAISGKQLIYRTDSHLYCIGGETEPTPTRPNSPANDLASKQVRNLDELNSDGQDSYPWLSSDGLTIYWATKESENWIWTANRIDEHSRFVDKKKLFRGHSPVLTGDGLEMFLVEPKSNSIAVATRVSLEQPFSAPRTIQELPLSGPRPSSVSSNGLVLYLDRQRDDKRGFEVWTAHRSNRKGKWHAPQRLAVDPKTAPGNFTQAAVTPDGLRLYCVSGTGRGVVRLGVFSRESQDNHFGDFRYFDVATKTGRRTNCFNPRFVPATGELFVTSNSLFVNDATNQKQRRDIWVVKTME